MAMELFRDSGATNIGPSGTMKPLYWMLVLLSLVPLCIVLPMTPTRVGVGVIAGWIIMIWVAISFARGHFHYCVPLWVAFYPYCYYLFSFPKDRPLFTIDRAFVVLLVIEMLIFSRQGLVAAPLTRNVRISAYLWGLFLLVCVVSLASHAPSHELGLYRLLVEGMLMPAIFGLYAMRYFPLLKDLQRLHACACILGFGLFVTGLIEMTTDIDLFPWSGSEPMFTDTHLRRADGPFEQQIVLSVVAILGFFFIIYLRRLMPRGTSPQRALLHRLGCLASLGAALLPLNRGLIVALAPIAIIDCSSRYRLISRRTWLAFFSMIVLATVATKLLDPQLYEDRVSRPDNVYQRLAQHQETLRVVGDYPFFGVGVGLYHDVASGNPRYMTRWNGVDSMNVQHNVLMTVLSDQGVVGLCFYVAAQVFLIRAMWKIRKVYPPGWLAFLYCLLVYILIGLDYATVYFSDINLFYMFILGILYQQQTRMAREQDSDGLTSQQAVDQTWEPAHIH
jgi:O-Antigen ligase